MTKTITVRYFASIREAMGTGEETWATTAPTVAALRQELAGRSAQAALALAATVGAVVAQVSSPVPMASRIEAK